MLRHQQQRTDEGIALIQRALVAAPGYVDAWSNLGNVYKESGHLDEAERAYRRAIAIDRDHVGSWNNLGVVLRAQGKATDAVTALRNALERASGMPDAWFNLGNALRSCGKLPGAITAYRRVLALQPRHTYAQELLGRVLYVTVEREEATKVFRRVGDARAGNPIPAHMLAACSGVDVPARASDAYVRKTFDHFAASFDEVLLQRLDYRAPEVLCASLADIASADTLCYFGDLASVVHAPRTALRTQGWLAFTLVAADDIEAYRINPHGRYSHARAYVTAILDGARFERVSIEPASLRLELGKPIGGWVVRARVPA